MKPICWLWLTLVLVAFDQAWAVEPDSAAIERFLKQPVTGPDLPLMEMQLFCEARVARMPEVASPDQWQQTADSLRDAVLNQIVFRGKAAPWRKAPTRVQWLDTMEGGAGYRIRKLRYEALPNVWIPALLYEPNELSGKVPIVLNVNGHSAEGKVYRPKQARCINQAKRGMLALNVEWFGMGQLRTPGYNHAVMNQLDLCGASGLAPFYLAMKRGLDILLALDHADPDRLAVTGLSGGGWQTIVISALDPRVTLSVPVAGYSSYLTRTRHSKDLGDSEQTPNDLATLVDYTHLTAMRAPRPTLLIYNAKDNCCFESGYALGPLLTAAHPIFTLFDASGALESHVNYDPGTHNYEKDNREALYRAFKKYFYDGDPQFPVEDLPWEDELKTAEQLHVPLPDDCDDFHTLALKLSESLPETALAPSEPDAAERWRAEQRSRLTELVRARRYDVKATCQETVDHDELQVEFWQLAMDNEWTVPAVVFSPDRPQRTVVLLADTGRAGAAAHIATLVARGDRVVAIDTFGFGECTAGSQRDTWLFSILVAGVGERPLGIQASQAAAAARWASKQFDVPSVELVAVGPRTSLAALVASALEQKAISKTVLHGALRSLKDVLRQNWSARQQPEAFCFGLLQAFDVEHLVALAAPHPVEFEQLP